MIEEKDVTYNFVSYSNDLNEIQQVAISSDIDDDIDYLTIQERLYLINQLIIQCSKQIIVDSSNNENIEDYDNNNEVHDEICDKMFALTQDLLYLVLNDTNNMLRAKFNMKPELLEYSVQTYFKSKHKDLGLDIYRLRDSIHSNELHALDPLQAGYSFGIDVIDCLLDNGVSKSEAKKIINDTLTFMKQDFMECIDEYKIKK